MDAETASYLLTEATTLAVVLAGPWLHLFSRRRSPAWLNAIVLVLAVFGLIWWGLPYGVGSAGCWLELAFDGSDPCTFVTDYLWVPILTLMLANVVVGAVHQMSGGPGGGDARRGGAGPGRPT